MYAGGRAAIAIMGDAAAASALVQAMANDAGGAVMEGGTAAYPEGSSYWLKQVMRSYGRSMFGSATNGPYPEAVATIKGIGIVGGLGMLSISAYDCAT